MARKNPATFRKRQRELAKARKREEKQQRKVERRAAEGGEDPVDGEGDDERLDADADEASEENPGA